MNITTKYSVGDKVYYHMPEHNQFATGEIERITSQNTSKKTTIYYVVKNQFHVDLPSDIFDHYQDLREQYQKATWLNFNESELFSSIDELRASLELKHMKKMLALTEKETKGSWSWWG